MSSATQRKTAKHATTTSKKRAMQVNVVVRVRPLLPYERLQPIAMQCIKAGHGQSKHTEITITSPSDSSGDNTTHFAFEKCYDDTTPQRMLFQREIQPAIAKVLQGINTTIFAYGATGTGKTFTMEGSKRNLGMIPRAVKRLFEVAAEQKRVCQLELSYLEIYNDKVLDLLVPASQQTDLPIRQQSDGTIAVQGLTRKRMTTLASFETLYEKGSQNRKCAATDLNAVSSRSHSILMIHTLTNDGQDAKCGKLHLIDLGGSEDNRRTGNQGTRLIESGKINMSLFVLGKVIMALNQGDVQRIPFRDSKLTRMLQDSLGGSSYAVMICTVAPTEAMATESLQTLQYASKARGIVNQVVLQSITKQNVNRWASRGADKGMTTAKNKPITSSVTVPSTKVSTSRPGLTSRMSLMPLSGGKTLRPAQESMRASSLSPPQRIGSMEHKLPFWKQTHSGKSVTVEKSTSPSTTSTIGIKRPGTLGLPTPPSSLGRSITTQALRVPVQKKSRLSFKPVSTAVGSSTNTTQPFVSSSFKLKNITQRLSDPCCDKENTPINTMPTTGASATTIQEWTPVELAKKLISVAIDLEKKKRFGPAYCVFTRAYHVLPDENPKLIERLEALETTCPLAKEMVPSQQMSTTDYMQLVLEMDLLDVLNHGTIKELTQLYSIGDKRAEKIIEARPFKQLSDLCQAVGITDKVLQKLHEHHIQW